MTEFSQAEKEQIFALAENITGNCQQGSYRRDVIIANVLRRVSFKKEKSLQSYLDFAISDDQEFSYLVSALTIHTTEWFREQNHFQMFHKMLGEELKKFSKLKILSAGCSTGEEVYSFALVGEAFRKATPRFDYDISAFDIDPVSVEIAKKASYENEDLKKIPENYHPFLHAFSQDDGFSFRSTIKHRCHFYTDNLMRMQHTHKKYDVIICRNVLIYFTPDNVKSILKSLLEKLSTGGVLIIGHSDSLNPKEFGLKSFGNSVFQKI
jgi:chemotaxis methyl-accepting protein methylase